MPKLGLSTNRFLTLGLPLILILTVIFAMARFDVRFQQDNVILASVYCNTVTRHDQTTRNTFPSHKLVTQMDQTSSLLENLRASFVKAGQPIGSLANFSNTKEKIILLWTPRFKKKNWISMKRLEKCSTRCRATMDRGKLLQSDAVIMHAGDFDSVADLPSTRLPRQRWIYHGMESPPHTHAPVSTGEFDGIFNWTATFRQDSDAFISTGYRVKRNRSVTEEEHENYLINKVRPKKHLAIARVSHCNTQTSHRIEYIRELQRFTNVDFYGNCGDYSCPKHSVYCDHKLMRKYKFFLAFENSYCRDYISEKFWYPLGIWDTVPVVWGGEHGAGDEYRSQAPPHSFINKADFDSPQELGKYLSYLDTNRTMYESYFTWRKDYHISLHYDWCRLCDALHDEALSIQTYSNLSGWYRQDSCQQIKRRKMRNN